MTRFTTAADALEQAEFQRLGMPRMNDAPETESYVVMARKTRPASASLDAVMARDVQCNFRGHGERLRRLRFKPRI